MATFEIMSVDAAQKRIGLAPVEEGSSRSAGAPAAARDFAPGTIVTGKVERLEKFGVLVFLSPGRTGLIPSSETGVDRDTDLTKIFPVGSDVEVAVLEADPAGRRIRLSRTAVARLREQAELREFAARPDAEPRGALGSLGDKLRDALQKR
jgi:ribosomal protein S1